MTDLPPIRLQKHLSQEGICSRREAEAYIKKGWITLNGKTAQLGDTIDPSVDTLELSNQIQQDQDNCVLIAFHKPRGVVTNCPQKGETEITDLLPDHLKHLNAIGRLDKDSEGLILLTDSGQISKSYLAADVPHERVYQVWLNAAITTLQIQKLETGITLFGSKTKSLRISKQSETMITMTMREGKNRQIRRMIQKVGLQVTRLKRLQFGEHTLGSLQKGSFRSLINPTD